MAAWAHLLNPEKHPTGKMETDRLGAFPKDAGVRWGRMSEETGREESPAHPKTRQYQNQRDR